MDWRLNLEKLGFSQKQTTSKTEGLKNSEIRISFFDNAGSNEDSLVLEKKSEKEDEKKVETQKSEKKAEEKKEAFASLEETREAIENGEVIKTKLSRYKGTGKKSAASESGKPLFNACPGNGLKENQDGGAGKGIGKTNFLDNKLTQSSREIIGVKNQYADLIRKYSDGLSEKEKAQVAERVNALKYIHTKLHMKGTNPEREKEISGAAAKYGFTEEEIERMANMPNFDPNYEICKGTLEKKFGKEEIKTKPLIDEPVKEDDFTLYAQNQASVPTINLPEIKLSTEAKEEKFQKELKERKLDDETMK